MIGLNLAAFNAALDNGAYAWPGGYALRAIMADGESVCFTCLTNEAPRIREAIADGIERDWIPAAIDIHWEGEAEQCAHCGAAIESEYGNPDEDESAD